MKASTIVALVPSSRAIKSMCRVQARSVRKPQHTFNLVKLCQVRAIHSLIAEHAIYGEVFRWPEAVLHIESLRSLREIEWCKTIVW